MDNGRIIELKKFKTYELYHHNLWSVHKLILNQMCPLMRHNHDTHFLSEGQSECVIYHSNMDLSLRITIHHISLSMIFFLTYSEIVMNRDFDRWLETMTFEMNSLYINQVWTMVETPMGVTQQIANRNVNLDLCWLLPHTI